MSNEAPVPRRFLLDEFNTLKGDDELREQLRSIDGVPAVSYQVRGEKVFVFEKLVQLVKQNGHNLTLAADLVSRATIAAREAVEEWAIFPQPYYRAPDDAGQSQVICHTFFNARLSRKYADSSACIADAARLLLGHPVAGEGDFVYRGQPMILREPFSLDRLPPRPHWVVPQGKDAGVHMHLRNTDFVSGFAPVTESLFARVKQAEKEWNHAIAATCSYMDNPACSATVWARAAEFVLEQLELTARDIDEYDPEYYRQFQARYPELAMLSPAAVQKAYNEYSKLMWEYPERRDGFLYHLIGCTVSSDMSLSTPEKTGKLIAHALLTGVSVQDACRFGAEAQRFDTALSRLAYQIFVAFDFIAADSAAAGDKGHSCH